MPGSGDEPMELGASMPASARAYAWTRSKIINGTFAGATMISESDVSDALGISRTPVREAFLRLAAEGTLKLFPKKGALVVPITADDIRDVIDARLLVESWAVATVAGHPSRDMLVRRLQALVDRHQHGSPGSPSAAEYQEADRSFHEAIVAATGNRLVEAFYHSLRDRQLRMGAAALAGNGPRATSILAEHQAIIGAIAGGDAEAAVQLVEAHISATGEALGARADRPGPRPAPRPRAAR